MKNLNAQPGHLTSSDLFRCLRRKASPVLAVRDLVLGACRLVSGVCCLGFLLEASTSAQSYSVDWSTIDGGGGASTGGVYSVTGTIGQPDAGPPMTNGQYSVTGGFWAFAAVVQTPGAPWLSIVASGPGQATVAWSPATPGWALQETLSLSAANWTNSPSGATNPAVVPAALPRKFYRLHRE
jgi:hypothetical protein